MIGFSAANYVLLTADRIEPDQAKAFGIVTEVTEPDQLMVRAEEIAQMIASNAPLPIEGARSVVQAWRKAGIDESLRTAEWMNQVVLASADAKEGPAAFAEKRDPVWTGG